MAYSYFQKKSPLTLVALIGLNLIRSNNIFINNNLNESVSEQNEQITEEDQERGNLIITKNNNFNNRKSKYIQENPKSNILNKISLKNTRQTYDNDDKSLNIRGVTLKQES